MAKNERLNALVSTNKTSIRFVKDFRLATHSRIRDPNIRRRMMATDELVDRIGQPAIKPVAKMMDEQKVRCTSARSRLVGAPSVERIE